MSGRTTSTSPSVLSHLRQYRFQKKPSAPGAGPSGSSSNSASSSGGNQVLRVTSSGTIISTQQGGVVYKRIRVPDSDSDDTGSPAKKTMNIVQPAANVIELTTAVKERRFRNMSEMFPEISPMFIKNTLVKHAWNEERTRDELLKHDPESQEKPQPKVYFGSRPGQSGNNRPGGSNGSAIYRGVGTETCFVARKPISAKGGHARRGSSGSEDDDFGVRKGKDDRVYDSSDSDNEVTDDLIGDKKKVYEFLNTANLNELSLLSGCSQKKAETIMALRPFNGWMDMVTKLNTNKGVSTELLNSTQELLSTRCNIQRLMKKCVGLAQQLEAAVAAGAGLLQQPKILDSSLQLAPYQIIGLNWLAVLHKQGVSGILADEMGLGKTVQVIAFLAHLKETGQARGSHLIVVPASTLDNWSGELARWSPALRVSRYYGAPDERRQLRVEYARAQLRDIDVILTTYTMVSSCPEERKMFRVTPLHYVIYDEAHMLKNMATQRYDNLLKIKSKHRLLLTGTPLQNNLLELMSLLAFVMPHMFSGKTDDLKSLFQKTTKSVKTAQKGEKKSEDEPPAFEQHQITQAKRIMKPFVLRRLKRDVLQDLPKKTNHTELCPMSPRQEELYKRLIAGFAAKDGTIHATTEQSGMSMMMDMRKLANHPLLLRNHYQEGDLRQIASRLARDPGYREKNEQYLFDDLLWMSDFQIHLLTQAHACIKSFAVPDRLILDSGKFQKLDSLLPTLKAGHHRVLIFSQFTMMLDVLEPYLALRGYRYLRLDGATAVSDRQDLIDQYNQEDIFVFLLSTRAGGLGINLTAADTVVIHDVDFNPYNDKQAEDRCHRMGQKRPVTIYRLLSAGTIEEGIHQVAQEKLSLERHVTGADENEAQEQKNVVRLLSSALGLTSPNK